MVKLPEVSVVLVGVGEHAVRLHQIDSRAYGLEPGAPIDRTHHLRQRRDWYETLIARPNQDWHAGQPARFSLR